MTNTPQSEAADLKRREAEHQRQEQERKDKDHKMIDLNLKKGLIISTDREIRSKEAELVTLSRELAELKKKGDRNVQDTREIDQKIELDKKEVSNLENEISRLVQEKNINERSMGSGSKTATIETKIRNLQTQVDQLNKNKETLTREASELERLVR